jgi:hypothetical protein
MLYFVSLFSDSWLNWDTQSIPSCLVNKFYILVSTSIHLYCAYRKVNKFSCFFGSIILLVYGIVISCGGPSHQVGIVVAGVALIPYIFLCRL